MTLITTSFLSLISSCPLWVVCNQKLSWYIEIITRTILDLSHRFTLNNLERQYIVLPLLYNCCTVSSPCSFTIYDLCEDTLVAYQLLSCKLCRRDLSGLLPIHVPIILDSIYKVLICSSNYVLLLSTYTHLIYCVLNITIKGRMSSIPWGLKLILTTRLHKI